MRRDKIVDAVDRLKKALQTAQVREVLSMVRNGAKSDNSARTQKILSTYSLFSQHYLEFGDEEKHLMKMFGIEPLTDVTFWSSLLDDKSAGEGEQRKSIMDVDVGVYNILYVMPKLRDLLMRDADHKELMVKLEDGANCSVKRLRLFVSEQGNGLTETFVMTNIIKAIEDCYETLFFLHKVPYVPLTLGSIDSGTAKKLDFFGASEIMDDIQAITSGVWVRIKHSTEKNIRYQIEVAMMAIGFVQRVKDAQRSKYITEDEGQRISRTVAKSVEVLLRNGAYTEEMEQVKEVRASEALMRKAEQIEYQNGATEREIEAPDAQTVTENVTELKKPGFLESATAPIATLSNALSGKERTG